MFLEGHYHMTLSIKTPPPRFSRKRDMFRFSFSEQEILETIMRYLITKLPYGEKKKTKHFCRALTFRHFKQIQRNIAQNDGLD